MERIIFALDVSRMNDAKRLVRQLANSVGCFKVGLQLFIKEGPDIFNMIKDNSPADIFLDLKLNDIPSTIEKAVEVVASHRVKYVTVHPCPGVNSFRSMNIEVLAVTNLTSLPPSTNTFCNATWAYETHCAGVICSGWDAFRIKKRFGTELKIVVPGIRPDWHKAEDDQLRTVTPKQAIREGADMIVVGRPIRTAHDPREAAFRILNEISEVGNDSN